jgi:uncharacterized protein
LHQILQSDGAAVSAKRCVARAQALGEPFPIQLGRGLEILSSRYDGTLGESGRRRWRFPRRHRQKSRNDLIFTFFFLKLCSRVRFEFDPDKSQANKLKHGIDFPEATELWNDPNAIESPSDYPGEERIVRIGKIGEKFWTAIFTYRPQSVIRIISVRRGRANERKRYEDFT